MKVEIRNDSRDETEEFTAGAIVLCTGGDRSDLEDPPTNEIELRIEFPGSSLESFLSVEEARVLASSLMALADMIETAEEKVPF